MFLNLGLTHTKHPETGARNLGMYRLQRHDSRTVGLHWQIHKDSNAHHAVAERRGERLPVAIAFGCDPAVTYAASAPLPAEIDEYLFAGFLRRKRVEMVDCLHRAAAGAGQRAGRARGLAGARGRGMPEGPFGDHTGFYTPVEPFPALRVDCMTMQRDPVFQTIVVGRPPQEDGPIGKATERIFLPLLRLSIPDIVDYDLPVEGVFHNCVIVSIDKRFPKHAQKVMNAIWGAGLLSLSKLIVVVDADCDVHDYSEVAWRALGNVDYAHDLLHTVGPVDHLDHASYEQFWGGKVGLDATRKLPDRGLPAGRRLADRGGHGPGRGVPSGHSLAGVRDMTAQTRRSRPGQPSAATGHGRVDQDRRRAGTGPVVPPAGGDRALGLRAAVRLRGGADRDGAGRAVGRPGPGDRRDGVRRGPSRWRRTG